MLVLTRKPGESIILKHADIERITITVLDNGRGGRGVNWFLEGLLE